MFTKKMKKVERTAYEHISQIINFFFIFCRVIPQNNNIQSFASRAILCGMTVKTIIVDYLLPKACFPMNRKILRSLFFL